MLHFIYYSTNIRTEYFKHAAHSPFFYSSKCRLFHNATFFGSCVIHILYTVCAKIKKKSGAKGLRMSVAKPLLLPPCVNMVWGGGTMPSFITDWLTNHLYRAQSLSWSRSSPCFMRPKIHFRVHKSSPLVPVLSQINPIHTLAYKAALFLQVPYQFPAFQFSPNSCHMPEWTMMVDGYEWFCYKQKRSVDVWTAPFFLWRLLTHVVTHIILC